MASTRPSRGKTSQTAASTAIAVPRWAIAPASASGRYQRRRPAVRAEAGGGGAGGGSPAAWSVGAGWEMTLVNEGLLAAHRACGVSFLGLGLKHLVAQQAPDLVAVADERGI